MATSLNIKEILRRRLINQSYSERALGENDTILLANGIDQEHFDYLHTDRGLFSLITFIIQRKNAVIMTKYK